MEVVKARLLPGFAQINITYEKLGFRGTFTNPWSLVINEEGPILYEIGILVQGTFDSVKTALREQKVIYDLLDVHKIDWVRNPDGAEESITQEEARELQAVLKDMKEGRIQVEGQYGDKFGEKLYKSYLDERVDFLTPRIVYVPRAYIPGTSYARVRVIEDSLKNI